MVNRTGHPLTPRSAVIAHVHGKKKQFKMSKTEFNTWAKTDEGKASLVLWGDKISDQRKAQGPNCRISKKMMESWAGAQPAVLKRQSAKPTDIIEPEDHWVPESKYIDDTGRTPADDDIECEWLEKQNGERFFGFWKESGEPIKRGKKAGLP